MQCRTREGAATQWVLAHSRCAGQHCCSAMAFGDRRCRCSVWRNIRGRADASSCHVPEPNRGRDSTARHNRPAPFGSRPPPALRAPFPKRESVLCPVDSDSARASRHGDFPASWSRAAAYLPCLARAYGLILHRTYGSTITRIRFEKENVNGTGYIRTAAEQGGDRSL